MKKPGKTEIIESFSAAADTYSESATLANKTAERLANALRPWQYSIPDGPVLEIGCGTGFFTEYLIKMYPGREIIISDASDAMVQICRKRYQDRERTTFMVLDAESHEWPEEGYSLITGNFVTHWFRDAGVTLSRMCKSLKPGGFMLMSFPASESFPQWKEFCVELGIPFTANPLPDVEKVVISLSMGPIKVDYYEDQATEHYDSVFDFFKTLKRTGSSASLTGKRLTPKQLKLLNNYWLDQNNGRVTVHYHTVFLAIKRDL
jgi:malonyl-CoA O-methyltransferase